MPTAASTGANALAVAYAALAMSIILPICGCLLAALFVVIILKKKPQAAAALVEATPGLIEMKKGSDSAAPAGEV